MTISPLQDPLLRVVPVVDGYKVLEPAVLVEKLPEGGMAAVYRGLHLDLKVDVAVKVLKRTGDQAYSPQAVARFRQEAEQAARLNDPNLVRIYDFPASKIGLLYLVMEFIDGETIESRVQRKGRLSPHETVTIGYHSARGLQAAHLENVVHRDIKPPNILISKRGHVKVTDLGIAKAQDSAAMGMTQEITLLGTPQYMAPELWRGARFASAASDVFALGATIAFMLTGRHVLDGSDTNEIMHKALTQGFPDVAKMVPGVPPQLANLVRLSTAQAPADRIAIDELILMLRELLDLYHGEFPLADAKAGLPVKTMMATATRLPSRSDLARIREQLEQTKTPTPIPGTMVVRDTPATVVKQARERVNLYGTVAGTTPRKPVRKKRGGLLRKAVVLALLAAFGAGGWFAVQKGWVNEGIAWVDRWRAGNPTPPGTQPATTPSTQSTQAVRSGVGGNEKPVTPVATNDPPVKPVDADPTTRRTVVTPAAPPEPPDLLRRIARESLAWAQARLDAQPVKPVGPEVKPVNPLERGGQYGQIARRVSLASDAGKWPEVLTDLRDWRNAAEAESQRAAFVTAADSTLMKFRAEHPDLAARRKSFASLPQQVDPAARAGSGVAALLLAEHQMDVQTVGGKKRVAPADPKAGLEAAVTHLQSALLGTHELAKRDAYQYLLEAKLAQLEYLGAARRWPEMVAWLKLLPVKSYAQAVADGMTDARDDLNRCLEVAGRQLQAFRAAASTPDGMRTAVGANVDLEAELSAFVGAGSDVAALVSAESLIAYDKQVMIATKPGAMMRIVQLCEKARGSRDAAVSAAATAHLVDAYTAAARSAIDRSKTDQAALAESFAMLARAQTLVMAPNARPELATRWRQMADEAVTRLRQVHADLDGRRQALPALPADLKPLADAGVFAARLALAETTIGYEQDPVRAVPRQDPDFKAALGHLAACISSAECPKPIKDEALGREWDVLVYFLRRDVDAKQFARVADQLKILGGRAEIAGRVKEYGALVDDVLRLDRPERLLIRVKMAEDLLGFEEDKKTGLRRISRHDPETIGATLKLLEGVRESPVEEARTRGLALVAEIGMLDPTPQKQGAAFSLYYEAIRGKPAGRRDVIAVVGVARFYTLSDAKLAELAPHAPDIVIIQRLKPDERAATAMGFYQEAAFQKDKFGLFLAGQYSWSAFTRTEQRRLEVVRLLTSAVEQGHVYAKTELEKVKKGS